MILEKLMKRGSAFLGVQYPIICGAMTWISDSSLVKTMSDHDIFPVLAGGNSPPDIFEKEIDTCLTLVHKPFGVNLITIAPNFKAQYEILLTKKVPVVIFAGSFPRKIEIQKMQQSDKKVMSFASEESLALQQISFGIDGLILEGSEAGGHIGHVSLLILLQQVLFKFSQVPIFVGGGIAHGNMIAHLLLMGAAGCQLGTRFVMTKECNVHDKFKEAFVKAKARQAVATPQYDSKLPVVAVRALKNKGSVDFGKLQLKLLRQMEDGLISRQKAQYEVEKYWMGALKKAVVEGDVNYGSLMAGQSVGLVHEIKPVKGLIEELLGDAEKELSLVKERLR